MLIENIQDAREGDIVTATYYGITYRGKLSAYGGQGLCLRDDAGTTKLVVRYGPTRPAVDVEIASVERELPAIRGRVLKDRDGDLWLGIDEGALLLLVEGGIPAPSEGEGTCSNSRAYIEERHGPLEVVA